MKKQEINKKKSFEKTMTPKAFEANRKNARKSTGPKTQRSKFLPPSNLKHGILASVPVLPIYESQKEYDKLVIELKKDLCPHGTLEIVLVEKIANIIWKTRRLARYENAHIRWDFSRVVDNILKDWVSWKERTSTNEDLAIDVGKSRLEIFGDEEMEISERLLSFVEFDDLPEDGSLEGKKIFLIINTLCDFEYLNRREKHEKIPCSSLEFFDVKELWPDIFNENFSKTKKQIKEIISIIAKQFGKTQKELYESGHKLVLSLFEEYKLISESVGKEMEVKIQQCLFDQYISESVVKLEAHLNRQLLQTLHELQRIQGMRIGISRPPEAIDITGENI
ncbi:MAG TPA: hypothetical protein PLX04_00625 [Caldisericia bacterium]|nr:hypothetical protein [Caldisericia bacterium]